MTNETAVAADAAERYAIAHAAHYTAKDVRQAFGLYQAIIAAHPHSTEADYSRTQIMNILKSVVSVEEVLATSVAMVATHLAEDEPPPLPLAAPAPEVLD